MRIIAGAAKSRRLAVPAGVHIRPTTDAIREALFSSIADRVEGARFADLFAGCGSVGIEALSRGADHCVFLEKHPRCVATINANLEATGLAESATVLRGPVERTFPAAARDLGPFDVLFADPPYDLPGFTRFLEPLLAAWEGVAEDGLIVVQCAATLPLGATEPARVKRYGESELRFYERS